MLNLFNKSLSFKFLYRHKTTLIVFLILISALALRLYNFRKYPLWFDEIVSYRYSHQVFDRELANTGVSAPLHFFEKAKLDPHPVFYYFLIYFCSFFLKSGWSLRLLSVIFSTLSLFVFYKLTRIIYNRLTSVIAIILMAMSPFQVWYAQEIRSYAISEFFSLLAILFLIKIFKKHKKIYWIYFFASSIFAFLTNYYFLLLFVISLSFLLHKLNLLSAKKIVLFVIMSVLSMPFLGLALRQYVAKDFLWLKAPTLRTFFLSFPVFGLGYSSDYQQLIFGTAVFVVLFAYGVFISFKEKIRYSILFISLFFLPILIIFLISRFIVPIYIDRGFIIVTPFYYIFVSVGIAGIRNMKARITICLFILALMVSLFINYNKGFMLSTREVKKDFYPGIHEKKQYRRFLDVYLWKYFNKGDIVAATDMQSFLFTLRDTREIFHYPGYHWLLFYPESLSAVEKSSLYCYGDIKSLIDDKTRNKVNSLYGVYFIYCHSVVQKEPLNKRAINRIWLVSSFWDKDGFIPVNDNHQKIKSYLLKQYRCAEFRESEGVVLERFEKE